METLYNDSSKRCPPNMHDDVPIVEGDQTVGVVCVICGRSVREDMAHSTMFVASDKGLVDLGAQSHHRKDPRF